MGKGKVATAIKDKHLDGIRKLTVAETLPEHFYKALEDGKVSTNVYPERFAQQALGHNSKAVHHAYHELFRGLLHCPMLRMIARSCTKKVAGSGGGLKVLVGKGDPKFMN